eukprot:Plantae.Rhodophyta-Purpureofilum_apyrenoidigerum.ctg5123.p1 GENE.Plantae.Rhodophyta-Purpureofilum_apyrenoidigerum.ctg5123~~Plantae.Rhodophyta-Purpureofilum_apyrenoidigerum.ctg5123.p1  ORF type:complete len:582 (+),score=126.41 Plantae.Rhodophyta-Purpureofilum_apyrenoidigerum.ctg5123:1117-2862(+)
MDGMGFVCGPRLLLRRSQRFTGLPQTTWRAKKAGERAWVRMDTVSPTAVDETVRKDNEVSSVDSAIKTAKEVRLTGEERVRFAPSPTGALHVGGARTALFNWLHAKNKGGKTILRVEDTDLARSTRESENAVIQDLKWLGITFDEGPDKLGGSLGPYRQSERNSIYVELANRLFKQGLAYPCFCSEEELEEKRKQAEAEGRPPQYDGTWRDADPDEVKRRIDAGEPYTIRFKIPDGTVVAIDDIVRGRVEWNANATVGDFILLRSTGIPVYNFCVAVDDALMSITTVIRAEEHLTNSLRQILILRALNFDIPRYAHCSLILGSDRSKLSKRHGATSCDQFRRNGYLPVAMVNYLALLGWNDGTTKELYETRDEIAQSFDLCRVSASPTMFDETKLIWINGQHLRKMPIAELAPLVHAHLTETGLLDKSVPADAEVVSFITTIFQASMDLVNDVSEQFAASLTHPLRKTIESEDTEGLLEDDGGFRELGNYVLNAFDAGELPDGSAEDHSPQWKAWIKAAGKATKKKGKKLFHPVRLALTGKMSGPDIGDVLRVLKLSEGITPDVTTLEQRIETLRSVLKEM